MPVTDLYYKATLLEKILDPVHMEFQTHYTEELPLFHRREGIYYNCKRDLYRNSQRGMGYFREPPPQPPAGPATNKRKLISVLKGTFEI